MDMETLDYTFATRVRASRDVRVEKKRWLHKQRCVAARLRVVLIHTCFEVTRTKKAPVSRLGVVSTAIA